MGKVEWDIEMFKKSTGIAVSRARHYRKWTQKKLAERVGVHANMISQIETGRILPNLLLYTAIFEALDYEVVPTPRRSR